jgi:hypothetical protein
MEALESFESNRAVIEDLATRTLAALPTQFERLCYLASLRDTAGNYLHEGLSALYPEAAVQASLAFCHREIFGRILEMPLVQLEWELRGCLAEMEGGFWPTVTRWRQEKTYAQLLPDGQPVYLGNLFRSNVGTLLDILAEERAIWQSAA